MTPDPVENMKKIVTISVMFLFLVILGCASQETVDENARFEEWRAKVEQSRPYSPSAIRHDIDIPEAEKEIRKAKATKLLEVATKIKRPLPTKKVSMTMRNTDVNVILRALAQAAGQNIVMNDGVQGLTQINVRNTPWDKVFLALLKTRSLTYEWEGDIIRVLSIEDLRRDQEVEELQTQSMVQEMESKKVGKLYTRVIPLNYYTIDQLEAFSSIESNSSDSTEEDEDTDRVESLFEKLLTTDDEGEKIGSVSADVQTNSLVVHAVQEDLVKIAALVDKLDQPTTQILLEAHIVETNKETARALGIQWGGLAYGNNVWLTPGEKAFDTSNVFDWSKGGSGVQNLNADNMADFPADLSGGDGFTIGLLAENVGSYILNIQLPALEEADKLHILSSPSIATVDNQMALIESGKTIPFQNVDASSGNISIDYKDATLRLEVTPHVIDKESLKLMIIINKDEVDFTNTVQGNPTIIKKTAKTNLILNDGATTVIGGLSKEVASNADTGIPGLMNIPGWFSYLFKREDKRNEMEEVLIFITPRILKQKPLALRQKSSAE